MEVVEACQIIRERRKVYLAKKVRLKIIPKPEDGTATIFTKGDSPNRDPFIVSKDGSYKLVCGSCEFAIATNVEFNQINDTVFHCPKCKRYNVSNTPKPN